MSNGQGQAPATPELQEQVLELLDRYSIHQPKGRAKGTLARRTLKNQVRKLFAGAGRSSAQLKDTTKN